MEALVAKLGSTLEIDGVRTTPTLRVEGYLGNL